MGVSIGVIEGDTRRYGDLQSCHYRAASVPIHGTASGLTLDALWHLGEKTGFAVRGPLLSMVVSIDGDPKIDPKEKLPDEL